MRTPWTNASAYKWDGNVGRSRDRSAGVELRDCSPDLGKLCSRTAEQDGRLSAVADPLCWPGLANVYAWLKMPIDKMIRLC